MEFTLNIGNGTELVGDVYKPVDKTDKVIVLVHGIGEHFGRYAEWASRFTDKRIAVVGVDLPGHGRSPGRRGYIKNYHLINDIIDELAKYVSSEFGNVPIGLYGHSLGGNIALNYLLTNISEYKFAVITSPWIGLTTPPPKALLILARVLDKVFPTLLQPNGLKLEHISRAGDANEKYRDDPLVHDRISARIAVEALKAGERILSSGDRIDIPILLLHGSDDKITSPEASKSFAEGKDNVTLNIWDEGYHELHNEPFKDDFFESIYNWVKNI